MPSKLASEGYQWAGIAKLASERAKAHGMLITKLASERAKAHGMLVTAVISILSYKVLCDSTKCLVSAHTLLSRCLTEAHWLWDSLTMRLTDYKTHWLWSSLIMKLTDYEAHSLTIKLTDYKLTACSQFNEWFSAENHSCIKLRSMFVQINQKFIWVIFCRKSSYFNIRTSKYCQYLQLL